MIQISTAQTQPIEKTEAPITSHIAPWLTKIAYPLAKYLVMPFFFRQIKITGRENIPSQGGVIIAPTHRSRWDALVVPYATGRLASGRDPYFMVSANEIKGLQGWFIRRLGGFPIKTDRRGYNSLKHSFDLLCQQEMVVIFPEGNIFRTNKVQPLKRGIAKIALEVASTKPEQTIKILPVSVKYSQPVPQRGCEVEVNIGKCLNLNQYPADGGRAVSIQLTQDLENALKTIHQE